MCMLVHQGETIHNTNKYTYNNLYCIIRNTHDASTYCHNTIPEIHAYLSDTVRSSPHHRYVQFPHSLKNSRLLSAVDWQSLLLPLILPCGTCHPCCCPTTQHKPDCNLQGHHAKGEHRDSCVLTIHSPE